MVRRTVPVRCEHPHGTTGAPIASVNCRVISSVTNTSGRMSRNSRSRECVTGGSALNFPVNRAFLKSASQKSSAVWPKAITFAPNPRTTS